MLAAARGAKRPVETDDGKPLVPKAKAKRAPKTKAKPRVAPPKPNAGEEPVPDAAPEPQKATSRTSPETLLEEWKKKDKVFLTNTFATT